MHSAHSKGITKKTKTNKVAGLRALKTDWADGCTYMLESERADEHSARMCCGKDHVKSPEVLRVSLRVVDSLESYSLYVTTEDYPRYKLTTPRFCVMWESNTSNGIKWRPPFCNNDARRQPSDSG